MAGATLILIRRKDMKSAAAHKCSLADAEEYADSTGFLGLSDIAPVSFQTGSPLAKGNISCGRLSYRLCRSDICRRILVVSSRYIL